MFYTSSNLKRRAISSILILGAALLHLSCESEETKKALMEQVSVIKAIDDSVKKANECCATCCRRPQKPTIALSPSSLDYTIHSAQAGIDTWSFNKRGIGINATLTNNSGFDLDNLTVNVAELFDAEGQKVGSFYPFFKVSDDCSGNTLNGTITETINLTAGCSLTLYVTTGYGCENNDLMGAQAYQTYRMHYRFITNTHYTIELQTDLYFTVY